MDKALIIFVRKPELGKVKTRLAAQIGNEKALQIYHQLLDHTRTVVTETSCDPFVFVTETQEGEYWKGFSMEIQSMGDLGVKMHDAFEFLFDKGYAKVVIIGSDCPELSQVHLEKAYQLLDQHDLVIGPASDGGYYLLGMKKLYPLLWKDKNWSTPSVYQNTISTIQKLQLSFGELEVLNDLDEEKDIPPHWREHLSYSI